MIFGFDALDVKIQYLLSTALLFKRRTAVVNPIRLYCIILLFSVENTLI